MTQKELLYVEDAILHELNNIDICTYYLDILEDKDLVKFMDNQLKKHQKIKKDLEKLMEDASNEW